jgi:Rrf2 family protein
MVDVALHTRESETTIISRSDIAERQQISADYAAQLFRRLGAAGLVRGVKGPGGGYQLARKPTAISAGDVIRAVEGPVAVVHCVEPGCENACDRADRCATHLLWKRVSESVTELLDSVTLQDLCTQARQLSETKAEET